MKFFCNLPQTEINFKDSTGARHKARFHQHYFETDNEEFALFLGDFQDQGVLVSLVNTEGADKIDYTPVFPDDEPEPITKTKSKGKR